VAPFEERAAQNEVLFRSVNEQIEHVVRTTDRYLIVEKDTPGAAEMAEISDPRD
jgi:hypothetical protein